MTLFRYECDPRKAASNLRKHGVSFEEATTVFEDSQSTTLKDELNSDDEDRFLMIGTSSSGRILFVVYTETDSSVRLIGARVATTTERRQYEEVGQTRSTRRAPRP